MAMNQQAFAYIKEKFTTQQHITDYVEANLQIVRNITSNIQDNQALSTLFNVIAGAIRTPAGVWTGIQMPQGILIAPPDWNDIAWRNAVINAIKKHDDFANDLPIDEIIKILKKFDDKIPTKNIDLTDTAYAKAFTEWYTEPYSTKDSCFNNRKSGIAMASFIIERVKNFNLNIDSPDKVEEPPAVDEESLGTITERQVALEEFLKTRRSYYRI